jgi:hypothetical protein
MVIDDDFSSVREYIAELAKTGIPVLWWNGDGNPPHSANDVRFVLLDLDLTGTSAVDNYDLDARVLGLVPGPFTVLIVAVNPTVDSAENLKKAYSDVNKGKELPGFIIKNTITKRTMEPDKIAQTAASYIREILDKKPIFESLLLAEQSIEYGKDASLAELAQERFEATIKAWVKSIAEDAGDESLAREFVLSLAQFQIRHLGKSSAYPKLKALLKTLSAQKSSSDQPLSSRIMHYRSYYDPDPGEDPWTGDTYETNGGDPKKAYATIITPKCSLRGASYLTLCYGFPIMPDDLDNENHFIFDFDPTLKKQKSNERKGKYLKGNVGIPRRFGVVDAFRIIDRTAGAAEKFVRLFFDFQSLESITFDEFKKRKWTRLCRLDSPYIEDLLQRYGLYSMRIGIPKPVE